MNWSEIIRLTRQWDVRCYQHLVYEKVYSITLFGRKISYDMRAVPLRLCYRILSMAPLGTFMHKSVKIRGNVCGKRALLKWKISIERRSLQQGGELLEQPLRWFSRQTDRWSAQQIILITTSIHAPVPSCSFCLTDFFLRQPRGFFRRQVAGSRHTCSAHAVRLGWRYWRVR